MQIMNYLIMRRARIFFVISRQFIIRLQQGWNQVRRYMSNAKKIFSATPFAGLKQSRDDEATNSSSSRRRRRSSLAWRRPSRRRSRRSEIQTTTSVSKSSRIRFSIRFLFSPRLAQKSTAFAEWARKSSIKSLRGQSHWSWSHWSRIVRSGVLVSLTGSRFDNHDQVCRCWTSRWDICDQPRVAGTNQNSHVCSMRDL